MHAGDLAHILSIGEIGEWHRPIRIAASFVEIEGFVGMNNLQPESGPRNGRDLIARHFQREPANRACLSTLRYRLRNTEKNAR
jgi:hypothetical protein